MKKLLLVLFALNLVVCTQKHKGPSNNPLIGHWAIHSSSEDSLYISVDNIEKSVESMMNLFISKQERSRLTYEDSIEYAKAFIQHLKQQQSIRILFTDSMMVSSMVEQETNTFLDTVRTYEWLSDKSIRIVNSNFIYSIISFTDTTLTLKEGPIEGPGITYVYHKTQN